MKTLKDFIKEASQQLSDVKTEWHPEEGLFTGKDARYIADYLLRNSKDEAQAMSRLVFYMNRAGDNLENKGTLEQVKKLIHNKKEQK